MYALRKWSVRHARLMESSYDLLERTLLALAPLLERIGYERLERPVAAVERGVKGALFDCRMCGQCALSSTGMSCPMNCPKNIRNGPCGGVRPGGYCEVKPEMRCVWVEAWDGARRMRHGEAIHTVQFAVDHRLQGSSSWLRVVREKRAAPVSEKALGNVVPVRPVNAGPAGEMRGAARRGGADAGRTPAPSNDPEIAHTGADGRRVGTAASGTPAVTTASAGTPVVGSSTASVTGTPAAGTPAAEPPAAEASAAGGRAR